MVVLWIRSNEYLKLLNAHSLEHMLVVLSERQHSCKQWHMTVHLLVRLLETRPRCLQNAIFITWVLIQELQLSRSKPHCDFIGTIFTSTLNEIYNLLLDNLARRW